MGQLNDFVMKHWVALLAAYWVFSAAMSSMPQPTANSYPGYIWAFRFGHSIAGSIFAIAKARFPQLADITVQTINPTPEGGVKVTQVTTSAKTGTQDPEQEK